MDKLTVTDALVAIRKANSTYARLFEKPGLDIGLYVPESADPQTPHVRDEIYVVCSGIGTFLCEGQSVAFGPGDVFFVAAGAEHRFMDFSADFSTWVIFIGARPET